MRGVPSSESRVFPPYLPEDRGAIAAFLRERGLAWEDDIEFSVADFVDGNMVGTGSLAGRVIKCLAVDESLRGEGMAAGIVSRLEAEAARRGFANPFVFTLPRNAGIFASLGYRPIGEVPGVMVLMEKGEGIERWRQCLQGQAAKLRVTDPPGPVSALVMNCNPFTLGHLHLVRTAAQASSRVYLFVVSEDVSVFPAAVRLRLVREETAEMANVTVIPGAEYIVSRATFPSYFLKGLAGGAIEIHAKLDANVFGRHVAASVAATRRFVGQEPYCGVTAVYNRVMKELLPAHGIELVEIPRLVIEGEAVSASAVRRFIRQGNLAAAMRLVPPHTAAFLASQEAAPVLAKVAAGGGRH